MGADAYFMYGFLIVAAMITAWTLLKQTVKNRLILLARKFTI